MPYLPYEEPGITVILSLTTFVVLLNGIRYAFDKLLYCGLLGEILLGIIWGLPVGGTALLSRNTQEAIQALGYLGLIGLVFEGGLNTSPSQLQKTMLVSVSVATVGLLVPIALSFLLLLLPFERNTGAAYPSSLAAFSAGASLCSTSLGTTFAILTSANMQNTRAGVILVGAAVMDDVVGLVMVNIVISLGDGLLGAWPIARPIVASFGLLLVTLFTTSFILKPTLGRLSTFAADINIEHMSNRPARADNLLHSRLLVLVRSMPHLGFILSIIVLLAFITIASFIDASVLFAAFLAGGVLSHIWGCGSHEATASGAVITFNQYYRPLLDHLLAPFFFVSSPLLFISLSAIIDETRNTYEIKWHTLLCFASVGFSIPLTSMFRGSIVWKGIVYAVLMAIAKASVSVVIYCEYFIGEWKRKSRSTSIQTGRNIAVHNIPNVHVQAMIIASAMIVRGEIGFLIASLSESSGALTMQQGGVAIEDSTGDDIFLVIIWAVVLCTITGPIVVGIVVKRKIGDIQLAEQQNSASSG